MNGREAGSARLLGVAWCFAGGVLAADAVHLSAAAAGLSAAAVACAAASRRRVVLLVVAAAVAGWALAGLRLASLDGAALARGAARNADAVLVGDVLGDPAPVPGGVRLTLGVRRAEVDGVPLRLRERASVIVRPPLPLRAGAIVRLAARLHPVGTGPPARALRHAGIAARAYASADTVTVLGRAHGLLARVAEAGRAAVKRAGSHLPPRERGLLLGVTIGDTSSIDPVDDIDFRTTGLSHLVAVSGANVAYVLALVAFGLRALRAARAVTVAAMGGSVVAFMAVSRFEPSVLRAGVMAVIALAGLALGARREASVALGAATLGLLAWDPFLVHSAGFQLSVLATAGILFLTPRVAGMLPPGRLAMAAAVTVGAQLAVAPVIAMRFGQVSLVAVAANLAVAPAVAPATMIGFLAALAGALWAPLAAVAVLARAPLAWMLWVAHALAQAPLASLRTPAGALGALTAAALALLAFAVRAGRRPRRLAPVVLAVALVAAGGAWARAIGPPPLGGLVVTMLDVGQGDAFLVRQGARAMLIDGGPDERLLLRELAAHGVRRVDLLVMTHPHADHVDGLVAVAEGFPLARALDPFIDADLPTYRAYERALARRGIPRDRAAAGMAYRLGSARVEVLWPPARRLEGTAEDVNNNSVVLRVRYGGQAVLFAGETQEEAQEELLAHAGYLRADVLKVSHHGSRHMLPAFYAATGAQIALIPVGPNTFGHPTPETLRALAGMRVLRSDRLGEVSVGLDGAAVRVRTERPERDRAATR